MGWPASDFFLPLARIADREIGFVGMRSFDPGEVLQVGLGFVGEHLRAEEAFDDDLFVHRGGTVDFAKAVKLGLARELGGEYHSRDNCGGDGQRDRSFLTGL